MIVSVVHSGTHFVMSFFRHLGHTAVWQHVYPTTSIEAVLSWDDKFIVPLRDPAECMLSHLHHCIRPASKPGYFEGVADCWRRIVTLPAAFVPIELKQWECLMRAAEVEGVPYADGFEWTPVPGIDVTPENQIYRSGDMDAFRMACPAIWNALQGMRDVLPVFKANGYADFAWE